MEYTHNWNAEFINNTNKLGINNILLALEIGSFEGLTSNYIIDNLLDPINGKLICVDPLLDDYITTDKNEIDIINNNTVHKYFNGQYGRFINNTNHNSSKIELYRSTSMGGIHQFD